MGKVKYETREIQCKDCGTTTTGFAYLDYKTGLLSRPEYCSKCSAQLRMNSAKPTPISGINWADAFNKYGYDEGDGVVHTQRIVEFLESKGYQAEYEPWGHYNTLIVELIDPNGKLVIRVGEGKYQLGFDDPHRYLPAKLIEMLDEEFGKC